MMLAAVASRYITDEKQDIKHMKFYCTGRGCRHTGSPEFEPTAVCFYMKGSNCTHSDVQQCIEHLLPLYPGARIGTVQFVPLPVHLDTVLSDNRWVITLNSIGARNRLAGTVLNINGQMVTLRRYDDVIQLEYRKCSRATHLLNMVTNIKKLDNHIQDVVDTALSLPHPPPH